MQSYIFFINSVFYLKFSSDRNTCSGSHGNVLRASCSCINLNEIKDLDTLFEESQGRNWTLKTFLQQISGRYLWERSKICSLAWSKQTISSTWQSIPFHIDLYKPMVSITGISTKGSMCWACKCRPEITRESLAV